MTKNKENKLQTPRSAQLNKKKWPLNLYSDPPPKKKKFQESDADQSDGNATNKKRRRNVDFDDDNNEIDFDSYDEVDVKYSSHDDDVDDNENIYGDDNNEVIHDKKMKPNSNKKVKLQSGKKIRKMPIVENIIDANELKKDTVSKADRDRRTLIIKNLKENIFEDDIKTLSKEIQTIRFVQCKGKKSKGKKCAFIEYSSESTAEKNKKILQGKKLDGAELMIDFVGSKSSLSNGMMKHQEVIDPRVLFVSGLKTTTTEKDIMKLFPGCTKIDLPVSRKDHSRKDFAFVSYSNETKCLEGHKLGQNLIYEGKTLIVQFAKSATRVYMKRQTAKLRDEKRKLLQQQFAEEGKATSISNKVDDQAPILQQSIKVANKEQKHARSNNSSNNNEHININNKPINSEKKQSNNDCLKQNFKQMNGNKKNQYRKQTSNNRAHCLNKINNQKTNKNKSKNKKEKSTDCDSALRPLLCVHG